MVWLGFAVPYMRVSSFGERLDFIFSGCSPYQPSGFDRMAAVPQHLKKMHSESKISMLQLLSDMIMVLTLYA